MQFKLFLSDSQGVVHKVWILSTSSTDENADVLVPLRRAGKDHLADEINRSIRQFLTQTKSH